MSKGAAPLILHVNTRDVARGNKFFALYFFLALLIYADYKLKYPYLPSFNLQHSEVGLFHRVQDVIDSETRP